MAEPEDLTVIIPGEVAGSVRAAVEAGDYDSAGEVVAEALRLWADRREGRLHSLETLRDAYKEGKASGEPRPLDADRILRDAHRRMADRGRV